MREAIIQCTCYNMKEIKSLELGYLLLILVQFLRCLKETLIKIKHDSCDDCGESWSRYKLGNPDSCLNAIQLLEISYTQTLMLRLDF